MRGYVCEGGVVTRVRTCSAKALDAQRAAEMAARERARREFEEAKRQEREAIARARREAAAEDAARGAMAKEDEESRTVRLGG